MADRWFRVQLKTTQITHDSSVLKADSEEHARQRAETLYEENIEQPQFARYTDIGAINELDEKGEIITEDDIWPT